MSHRTTDGSASARLLGRIWQYAAFALLFGGVYGWFVVERGGIPDVLLFGVLVVSLAKDVYDEIRLQRGDGPLVYAGVEHSPSNAILLGLLLAGYVDPGGAFAGVAASTWAAGLAAFDLLFDLSQDLRA